MIDLMKKMTIRKSNSTINLASHEYEFDHELLSPIFNYLYKNLNLAYEYLEELVFVFVGLLWDKIVTCSQELLIGQLEPETIEKFEVGLNEKQIWDEKRVHFLKYTLEVKLDLL